MRLVVVGGVAGGMSAAARYRRLDEQAEIIVLERGGEVSFANCGLPYFVSGEITDERALLVQTPESLRSALRLDVRVDTEAVALDPVQHKVVVEGPEGGYTLSYDALVLSPGALAARPPIPGIDSPRVTTLRTVPDALALDAAARKARRAVVLGAGLIGIEAAEALRMRGLETTIVELADHVLPPLETEMAHLVTRELRRLGIEVRDGVGAESIEHGEAEDVVVLSDGTRLAADVIVVSVGARPDTRIWQQAGVTCEGARSSSTRPVAPTSRMFGPSGMRRSPSTASRGADERWRWPGPPTGRGGSSPTASQAGSNTVSRRRSAPRSCASAGSPPR